MEKALTHANRAEKILQKRRTKVLMNLMRRIGEQDDSLLYKAAMEVCSLRVQLSVRIVSPNMSNSACAAHRFG